MTIIQQIDSNIPPKLITNSPKNNYNYIRNNEVEWEWKRKKEKDNDNNV